MTGSAVQVHHPQWQETRENPPAGKQESPNEEKPTMTMRDMVERRKGCDGEASSEPMPAQGMRAQASARGAGHGFRHLLDDGNSGFPSVSLVWSGQLSRKPIGSCCVTTGYVKTVGNRQKTTDPPGPPTGPVGIY